MTTQERASLGPTRMAEETVRAIFALLGPPQSLRGLVPLTHISACVCLDTTPFETSQLDFSFTVFPVAAIFLDLF